MPLTEAKQILANVGEVMSQRAQEHNHELPRPQRLNPARHTKTEVS